MPYLFDCRRWLETLDGKPALVRAFRPIGEWAQAEVSRMPDNTVRVVAAADLAEPLVMSRAGCTTPHPGQS
jgi:hypothetical protein